MTDCPEKRCMTCALTQCSDTCSVGMCSATSLIIKAVKVLEIALTSLSWGSQLRQVSWGSRAHPVLLKASSCIPLGGIEHNSASPGQLTQVMRSHRTCQASCFSILRDGAPWSRSVSLLERPERLLRALIDGGNWHLESIVGTFGEPPLERCDNFMRRCAKTGLVE